MAYPGKQYNIGNVFREKDMGNLLLMAFLCRGFFRYRNVELIADSHFGHIVPVAYLRLWQMYCTCAFRVSRKGISNIVALSKTKLLKEELDAMISKWQPKDEDQKDLLDDSEESDQSEESMGKSERALRRQKTQLDFFEKSLSLKPKGYYKVWFAELPVLERLKTKIYLHAVVDNKVVYRISTCSAALPSVPMTIVDSDPTGKKIKKSIMTSEAQRTYRKYLGFNDQSDAKRSFIGLSAQYFKRWPQKLTAKTLEDSVINGYLNYLIDPGCVVEP